MINTLNIHSNYSFMQGLNSPDEICKKLKSMGASSLCITDTNGFYGLINFIKSARSHGLTPIIGVEFREKKSCVIFVNSLKAYRAVCRHLSSYYKGEKDLFDLKELVSSFPKELFLLSFNKEILLSLKKSFKKNVFFELSAGFFNYQDYLWAKKEGISIIANNKVNCLKKSDFFSYKLLRAIDENTTLGEVDFSSYHNEKCYLFSEQEFESYFEIYEDSLLNLKKLKETLHSDWFPLDIVCPSYNGLSHKESLHKLKDLCLKNISKRYHGKTDSFLEKVYNRIDYEIEIIGEKKYASYFLNVKDISDQCEFTCGRGSSAASIVNYLLEITHVDPIEENLLFDRFMNLERQDPPDIDIDFPSDQRDDILDYVFDKFKSHVAMVSNHNYLRIKCALREVAKVFGIQEGEISYVSDRIGHIELTQKWKEVLYYANQIQGAIRHLSVHCGGVVITPNRIDDYAPIEISKKGYPILQWEKDQVEDAGLIKIDLLGNKGLCVIRDVILNLNYRGMDISYKNLESKNDEKTKDVFIKGDTVGVIHFESPRCRTLLKAFSDPKISTLSLVCSIIRPAAMAQVDKLLRHFKGERFSYPHPLVEETLKDSYGVMVYQEDVMRITKSLADFSSQQGNELRKVLAKKEKGKKLDTFKRKFFSGALRKGLKTNDLEVLWNDILSFAGYSFCKPHSDSYSLVAYKSAYLKAHYPAEFMAAVITSGGGFYVSNVENYLNEARRMGVIILPPDVNFSDYDYIGENLMMRAGLKQIKFIEKSLVKKILGERKKGVFKDVIDLLSRVPMSFDSARILLKSRSLSSLRGKGSEKQTYSSIMWQIYEFYSVKKNDGRLSSWSVSPILKKEYSHGQFIRWEQEFLGALVSFPSWFLYRDTLKNTQIIPSSNLEAFNGKEVILYGQKVSEKKVRTKYKETMSFVTFSDDVGMYNATFFPKAYEELRGLLFLEGSFLVRGNIERDINGYQVIVNSLSRIGQI